MSNIAEMPRFFYRDPNISLGDRFYDFQCQFLVRAMQIPSEEGLVNIKNGFKLLGYGVAEAIVGVVFSTAALVVLLARAIFTLSKEDLGRSLAAFGLLIITPIIASAFFIKVLVVDMIFCNQFARINQRSLYNYDMRFYRMARLQGSGIEGHGALVSKQGARFLVDKVLKGVNARILQDFNCSTCDPYIFYKSIYIYVAGSEKDARIPNFFKEITRDGITDKETGLKIKEGIIDLRKKLSESGEKVRVELENWIKHSDKHYGNDEEMNKFQMTEGKEFLKALQAVASEEYTGTTGVFITTCWSKAVEELESNNRPFYYKFFGKNRN